MEEERADELVSVEDGAVISDREQKCQAFASVAGCDQALAHCSLAENDWELERPINSYFEPSVESFTQERNPSKETQEGNPSEGTQEGNPSGGTQEGNPSGGTQEGNPSGGTQEGNPSGGTQDGNPSGGTQDGNPSGGTQDGNPSGGTQEGNTSGGTQEGNPSGGTQDGNPSGGTQEGNTSGGTQEGNTSEESTSGGQQMPVTAPDCCIDLTSDEPVVTQNPDASKHTSVSQKDESHFIFVTWNIDGLDISNLPERARAVCSYLALYSPDVVFLQEVIPPYYEYLKKRAVSYTIITGNEDGYFTAIMLKKSRAKLVSQEIVPFPTTSMMRNLLVVNVKLCGSNICLMTSHLESTKNHAKERMKQLGVVLQKILEVPSSTTVIFAGDTNLRDQEVKKIGGLPSPIMDVWEFLGKPEHCRYTWDTKMNNNLKIPNSCRLRFDRILYRSAVDGGQVIPQSLNLIGTEKLDCGRFPSDHWGLLCDFDVILRVLNICEY